MTKQNNKPDLFVVDGSNIATEGRSKPSLEQLNEAVAAFEQEFPDVKVTVVVDATFGHRIAKKEVKAFDAAVANNELVTPPAGAVGRGDAFILAIANKAGAGVFSNDSFQEFHGDYEWLFANGRLIGGKPVPHVGWVFVDRNPVRGPRSRESIRAAKKVTTSDEPPTEAKDRAQRRVRKKQAAGSDQGSPDEGSAPAEPAADTATTSTSSRTSRSSSRSTSRSTSTSDDVAASASAPKGKHVNDVVPFLEFVEAHPVGTSITAIIESYSSHGAYAQVGDALVYIPLRLMGDPAPTSARKVLKLGDEVELVVSAFAPERRSIDAALPVMASALETNGAGGDRDGGRDDDRDDDGDGGDRPTKRRPSRRRGRKRSSESSDQQTDQQSEQQTDQQSGRSDRRSPSSEQAEPSGDQRPSTAADEPPAKRSAKRKAPAKKQAAKKQTAKKQPAKKRAAKKAAAKKQAATAKEPSTKKAAAKKKAAATSAATKKKAAAKRAPAKRKAGAKSKAAGAAEQSGS